jgi:hypothetical protein
MPLKLRPTGLASPIDKDRGDFIVFSGEWAMGRIYEERESRQHLRWYWSLLGILGKPLDLRTDGRARRKKVARVPSCAERRQGQRPTRDHLRRPRWTGFSRRGVSRRSGWSRVSTCPHEHRKTVRMSGDPTRGTVRANIAPLQRGHH